jgi:hypothetical protein
MLSFDLLKIETSTLPLNIELVLSSICHINPTLTSLSYFHPLTKEVLQVQNNAGFATRKLQGLLSYAP